MTIKTGKKSVSVVFLRRKCGLQSYFAPLFLFFVELFIKLLLRIDKFLLRYVVYIMQPFSNASKAIRVKVPWRGFNFGENEIIID